MELFISSCTIIYINYPLSKSLTIYNLDIQVVSFSSISLSATIISNNRIHSSSFIPTDNTYEIFVPTKTESRSIETQKRLCSRNGPGFVLAAKNNLAMTLESFLVVPTKEDSRSIEIMNRIKSRNSYATKDLLTMTLECLFDDDDWKSSQ